MSPIVKMIACHYANRSGRGQAATFLPFEVVQDLVEAGQAVWNKRRTYVNFTKTEAELHTAARSIRMDDKVIFLNAVGDRAAMALVEGWRPLLRAA